MYEYVMIPIIMYESEICTMTESERLERFRDVREAEMSWLGKGSKRKES